MKILKLELQNYRNYSNEQFLFDNQTNVFYGNNAEGKTNAVEAIYLLTTTKSHRTNKNKELIKFNEKYLIAKLQIQKNQLNYEIEINISDNKTKYYLNKLEIKPIDLYGKFNTILFSPEDLKIIKESPKYRRNFIDTEISKLNKIYLSNLSNYKIILEQRNSYLKKIKKDNLKNYNDLLDIYNEQLYVVSKEIIEKREEFIIEINKILNDIHKELTGQNSDIIIKYNKNIEITQFFDIMRNCVEKDIVLGTTSYGIHKDDIEFFQNNINFRNFGSQGQIRTIAICLKLAQIKLIEKYTNDTPILLLDDVLSELDRNRQTFLLNSIKNIQTIITCTGVEEFLDNNFKINKLFKIENGKIKI